MMNDNKKMEELNKEQLEQVNGGVISSWGMAAVDTRSPKKDEEGVCIGHAPKGVL